MLAKPKLKETIYFLACFASTAAILAWRRPDQFSYPYIWVEEGTVTLVDYIKHGWISMFYPVAGYLVLPAKLIFLTSASISFNHLPRIEYWLTILFTAGVAFSIARTPTVLKLRPLCALTTLLLPINSEVFAVSEYAFWWGTILAFLVLLWDPKASKGKYTKYIFLTLGGLSSPMIIPISLMMVFRSWVFYRQKKKQ
ncbi:MAG: hypothetical protein KGI42_03720 [Xanthomonadaceae bacterium]|nr:hypothetical protein [Xanthomonadaceae bacterium]